MNRIAYYMESNLKALKLRANSAYDGLSVNLIKDHYIETDKDTPPSADGRKTDEIPVAEDEKNEKLKGPVDDK